MSRRAQLAMIAAAVVALGAVALYRLATGGGRKPGTHAVVVVDRSDSIRDTCGAVLGVVEALLAEHNWPKGSSLVVLGTGATETLSEPVELYRFTGFRRRRTVEGKSASAKLDREILKSVLGACEASPKTRSSPIYLSIRRGVELLTSLGCDASRCTLAVVSDGVETVEPGLVAALNSKSEKRRREPLAAPNALANASITVAWCGFAETQEPPPSPTPKKKRGKRKGKKAPVQHDALSVDRVVDVWRSLFAEPAYLEFAPICPKGKLAVSSW